MLRINPKIPPNQAAITIQQYFRIRRALRKVEEKTGINIPKASQKNILDLYDRLRNATGLPTDIQDTIQKSKLKPNDIFTPAELRYFQKLIHLPIITNHATHFGVEVKHSGYVFSTRALRRLRCIIDSHTGHQHAGDYFAFMSFGIAETSRVDITQVNTSQVNTVGFVGSGDVFVQLFESFAQREPFKMAHAWTSGHFHAFDNEQINHPVIYQIGQHVVKVNLHYEINYTPRLKFNKQFTFNYPNNTKVIRSFTRAEEVSLGRHIKPYHALRIIEYIRFLGIEMSEIILRDPNNTVLMAKLFDSLFTPGKTELHIPDAISVNNDYTIFGKKESIHNSHFGDARQCILQDDAHTLIKYLKANPNLRYYRFRENDYDQISLLNFAVLRQNEHAIKILISEGFDPEIEYLNTRQVYCLRYASRTALQDAITFQHFNIIKLLCEPEIENQSGLHIAFAAKVTDLCMFTAIAESVSSEIFNYLLQRYTNRNASINKLLCVAAYYNNISAISALIKATADMNATVELIGSANTAHIIPVLKHRLHNIFPLGIAAKQGHLAAVETLIEAKANANGWLQESGRFGNEFGIGDSPLDEAYLGLCQMTKDEKDEKDYEDEKIPQKLYLKLKSLPKNHIQIIKLLLENGACFRNHWRTREEILNPLTQLDNQTRWDSLLTANKFTNIIKRSTTSNRHEAFGLLLGMTKNNEQAILLGLNKGRGINTWITMGADVDYCIDKNLTDTVINACAYQSDIDLTQFHHDPTPIKYSHNNRLIEVHCFRVNGLVEAVEFTKKTQENDHLEMKRYVLPKLFDIQWIPLNKIKVQWVDYKGQRFPVFSYQDKKLPFCITTSLASLTMKEVSLPIIYDIAFNLHLNGYDLLQRAVSTDDVVELMKLVELGLGDAHDLSKLLKMSLEEKQFKITDYLLRLNVTLETYDLMLFFGVNMAWESNEKRLLPENITIQLYNSHKNILTKDQIKTFAKHAAVFNFLTFTDQLIREDRDLIVVIANDAYYHLNIDILRKCHSEAIKYNQLTAFINVFDRRWSHRIDVCIKENTRLRGVNIKKCFQVLDFLDEINVTKPMAMDIVWDACQSYEALVKQDPASPYIQRCLELIAKYKQHAHWKGYLGYTLYWCFGRFRYHDDRSDLAEPLRRLLIDIPLIALVDAERQCDLPGLDALLQKHHAAREIREFLLESSVSLEREDKNGDDCLQRAVKSNSLSVVNLLLATSFNNDNFKINSTDAVGNTPLDNAILLKYTKMVDLLSMHGATCETQKQDATLIPQSTEEKSECVYSKYSYSSDILYYGEIGNGKGLEHVLHLAELIKTSDHRELNKKMIYIAGPVTKQGKHSQSYERTLYQILCKLYPDQENAFVNKSLEKLIALYHSLQSSAESKLPIKLFLDVTEGQLSNCFDRCEYVFYPTSHGISLQDKYVMRCLSEGCIIYSHEGNATPESLKENGIYRNTMEIQSSHIYETYAANVLENIHSREVSKGRDSRWQKVVRWNEYTRAIIKRLVNREAVLSANKQQSPQANSIFHPKQSAKAIDLTTNSTKKTHVCLVM